MARPFDTKLQGPPIAEGYPLLDNGCEVIVDRITIGATPVNLAFGIDVKYVLLTIEAGSDNVTITGTVNSACRDLASTAAIDNGDGTVTLHTVINHGFAVGSSVTISGREQHNGTFTCAAGTATDEIVITTTYASEGASASPAGQVVGTSTSAVFAAGAVIPLKVAAVAKDSIATLVSAGTSTISMIGYR